MVFALLGGATKLRNNVWSSEAALWWNVIENAPNKSRAYNNYAVALNESGKFDESIKYFQKAIEVDGTYAEPHVNLASIYHARGDRPMALQHYMDALNIGEGHPSLFNNLGLFYFEEHNFAKAEYCFNECLKLCPYFSRGLRNLGTLYLHQGRLVQAEELYDRALKGDFVDTDMYFMHGVLCHDLGKFDKAIESFRKIDPGYKDTASLLSACLFNQHKYQEALPYLKTLCVQNPQNLSYAYNCALCLLNLGKSDEALPLFDNCRRDSTTYPFAGLHYGRCLFEVGQKDQAKHELALLVKLTKDTNVKRDVLAYMKEVRIA
jgi:tetratricopeptide (TPR) repeat protein